MESITPRKKFAITGYTPPYAPAQRTEPRFKIIRNYDSRISYAPSESHRLYITNEAMEQIFSHIEWGETTKRNIVEQGGILLGHVFRDENEELTYGIAEAAVAGSLAKGSSASLKLTHETWKQMLDSVDEMLNQNPPKNLQVIGWYHTHPNNLDVFMSGTDRSTQSRLFFHDWQFAIVMNPHKRIWRAFYGMNADECEGFVIDGIQDSASNYFPQELPAINVEQVEQDSNEKAQQKTKASQRKSNSTSLKKFLSRRWRLVKMLFGIRRKDKGSAGNQGQVSPTPIRQLPNAMINEKKINFFLWFFSFMLFAILLLQIVILCLPLFSSDQK